jgi:hypothetical protein
MSQDGAHPSDKKDLTGILDLPQADPVPREGTDSDPFSLNEAPPIEQVDDFASLDQIGMMDHPVAPEENQEAQDEQPADPFTPATQEENQSADQAVDPFPAPVSDLPQDLAAPELPGVLDFEDPFAVASEPIQPPSPVTTPEWVENPLMDDLRLYSESKKSAPFEPGIRNEYHLYLSGDFDPYTRDKLLIFITENSIGLTSSELDLQLKSNRVMLPRISEFSGIKLIQELRDSGVSFVLKKSAGGEESSTSVTEPLHLRYAESKNEGVETRLPILPATAYSPEEYKIIDSIKIVQYLRAEILEVEKSELFQELLDRMTESLRSRAILKGANAITHLQHAITPLRLPSQYQVEISASLLKKV